MILLTLLESTCSCGHRFLSIPPCVSPGLLSQQNGKEGAFFIRLDQFCRRNGCVAFFIFLCVKDMILQFCSFPGVDICPKLPHPVLSRHRHNRSLFYQSPNISPLHRQTGSFQVIRQKNLRFFRFQIQLLKLLQTYFYKRGRILWPHMGSDAPSPKHSHLLVHPCRAYFVWNHLQISEETYNNITRLVFIENKTGMFLSSGISESEREQRKQSNIFTTKIHFLAWLIEVTLY